MDSRAGERAAAGRSDSPGSPGGAAREANDAPEPEVEKTRPRPTSNKIANPELYADEDWDEPDDPLFRPKPQWVARVESGLFLSYKQFQAIKDYRRSANERISELRAIGDNKSRDDIDRIKKNIEELWNLSFEDSANRRRAKAAAADAENKIKEAAAAAEGNAQQKIPEAKKD